MDRTRAEFTTSIVLGLAAMVIPMTWWLRAFLLILMLGVAADLLWRSPITAKFGRAIRAAMIVVAFAIVLISSWKPLTAEYQAEGGLTSLFDFATSFFGSEYFRLLLAGLVGGVIGNQFAPARPRFRRNRRIDGPEWFKSYDVLKLADAEIVTAHTKVRAKVDALNTAMTEVVEEWRNAGGSFEKIRDAESKRDALNIEIKTHRDQSEHYWAQMQHSVHEKLSAGELKAKGFLMPVKPQDDPIPVPVDQWNFLRLTGNFSEASGKGISYVGVKIAKA